MITEAKLQDHIESELTEAQMIERFNAAFDRVLVAIEQDTATSPRFRNLRGVMYDSWRVATIIQLAEVQALLK